MTLEVRFDTGETLDGILKENYSFQAELGEFQKVTAFEYYTGPYEFTPTQETQIIPIGQKMASGNITVNPIPNNYGLITWNGAVLTVS
ncbi:MAG: hypothetical protein K6E41_04470 [Solobacterium sp.]|nr:hypothetical protein [Solobacterium sp.]